MNTSNSNSLSKIESLLLGVAVGDALGVPVEFKSRAALRTKPVVDMMGYGTHNQPPGTWSDDSSLTFCLAENLCEASDLSGLAQKFMLWHSQGYWTADYVMFDIGNATAAAISRLREGVAPTLSGGNKEADNGNGSLMRILPLAYFLMDEPLAVRFEQTKLVSAVTHAHPRSVIACFIAVEFAIQLLRGCSASEALEKMQQSVRQHDTDTGFISAQERANFQSLLNNDAAAWRATAEGDIRSSGYVIHTLEASIWCLLTTDNYPDAVLKAVNLGEDTDTTGAVTGGFAGLLYGSEQIPEHWLAQLARRSDILKLASRCFHKITS